MMILLLKFVRAKMTLFQGGGIIFLFLCAPAIAAAATILKGQIIDETTGVPIPGAKIEIRQGAVQIGVSSTQLDGNFILPLQLEPSPQVTSFSLIASHESFAENALGISITNGEPSSSSYELRLLPKKLVTCRFQDRHSIIVGHFLRSDADELQDLSERIAIALTYNILPRLQEVHIPAAMHPDFIHCEEANPRSITHAGQFARALSADAFISGDVSRTNGNYSIKTFVSDPFDLYWPPHQTKNENVSLMDPAAAELDPSTHVTILTTIAAAYQKEKRFSDCVNVTRVAERLLGSLSRQIEDVRKECQAHLGNQGLIRSSGP